MPRLKTKTIAEFGDFQTPPFLAARVCAVLRETGVEANSILEPTCGGGSILFAAADQWPTAPNVVGLELNTTHLAAAQGRAAARADAARFALERADFFATDWPRRLAALPEPLLVVGNPPWVTSSHVGALGGSNVPAKSNFQNHAGLDALTGKANFDISEWMLLQLALALSGRRATLAMLVKTAVARKVLRHCWQRRLPISAANIFRIDAMAHFDAAVDAAFLVIDFGGAPLAPKANVYAQLTSALKPVATLALAGDSLVADLTAFDATRHLFGTSPFKWRSGIKHDCSQIMELRRESDGLRNGLGERVEIEQEYVFPMLKTSEVANGNGGRCTRWMIVPQRRVGQSTDDIALHAPATWRYLQSHHDRMARRGSSIYRGKPAFSIFGVGDYSFAPWKIAISGMYKTLRFVKIGPCDSRPVVLDDVTNFLPCPTEAAADLLLSILESNAAKLFFRAHVFWDAKRPITVDLLNRLDLHALARELAVSQPFNHCFGPKAVVPHHGAQQANPLQASLW